MINKLIHDSIQWEKVGNYDNDQLKFQIGNLALSQEQGKFSLELIVNFVMPFDDALKIKALIKNRVPNIESVDIIFTYKDMVQREDDIIRLSIEYIIHEINGSYAGITRTIRQEEYEIEGKNLTIYAIGELAVEGLNEHVAKRFEQYLMQNFNIDKKVVFKNHTDDYEKLIEERKENEQKELQEAEKAAAEAAAVARQNAGYAAANGAGGAAGAGAGAGAGTGVGTAGNGKGTGAKGSNSWAQGGNGGQGGWRRKEVFRPIEGNLIMGKPIGTAEVMPLRNITAESGNVVIAGVIFKMDSRVTKNGKILATLAITDQKYSMGVKFFVTEEKWNDMLKHISTGDFVKIRGFAEWDMYERTITVDVKDMEKGERKQARTDNCEEKRVELHAHTKMSAMDGLNDVENIVKTAAQWGQKAVAITDHGVVQAFPDAAKEAKKQAQKGREIKILYGLEGYVFDDSDCINEDGSINYKQKPTNHIIIIAKTQEGLKNIYKLVSLSHLDYFYKRPRIPKSVLTAHREGLIIGSACEAGEVFQAILYNKPEEEIERIAEYYDYLEVQPIINNRFLVEERQMVENSEGLRELNRKVVALADKLGKPVVATTDAHYAEPEDAIYRNILFAGQGYKDAESGEGLYMRTTEEMLEEFSYLGEETAKRIVIDNTNLIADMTEEILPVPKGKFPPQIEGAKETLLNTCMEKAHSIYGNPLPEEIQQRLDKELNSIIGNGYAVMYVSAQMLVKKSNEDGYLVGSRGSVGSSFAATMAGITEVNPLAPHYICPECKHLEWGDDIWGKGKYDCGVDMPERTCVKCGHEMKRDGFTIPFETFLGFEGDKEPDIDLNFAGEYQAVAHRYVGEIFGEKNVFKAGTVGTVAEKTAFGYVKKFHEERSLPVNKYEIERLAQGCTGVKRTTGQHPGGMIIVPDDHEIYEFCPVQHPANDTETDIITTHFDYHKIDENLLKLDILGHDVPSMIRQLQELTGVSMDEVSLSDKSVLKIFNGIDSLDIKDPEYKFTHGSYAIPEFGTKFVRQMLDDTKPDKFADLVRISGFSHGTDVWLNNAQEFILSGQATMSEVISTRDDIMNYLILNDLPNKASFKIMEGVRKGKGLTEEQEALMREKEIPEWYIESCKRIKYMFPRAHAVAYVMMSYRLAWFKVHYPAEFYATYFTTKVTDFDAATILKGKSEVLKQMEYIEAKGKDALPKEEAQYIVLEVAYEMYARGYEFSPAQLGKSDGTKFMIDDGKVLLPFASLEGVGESAARMLVEEYKNRPYETIEEIRTRAKLNKTAVEALRVHGVLKGLPETDQLSMF